MTQLKPLRLNNANEIQQSIPVRLTVCVAVLLAVKLKLGGFSSKGNG